MSENTKFYRVPAGTRIKIGENTIKPQSLGIPGDMKTIIDATGIWNENFSTKVIDKLREINNLTFSVSASELSKCVSDGIVELIIQIPDVGDLTYQASYAGYSDSQLQAKNTILFDVTFAITNMSEDGNETAPVLTALTGETAATSGTV